VFLSLEQDKKLEQLFERDIASAWNWNDDDNDPNINNNNNNNNNTNPNDIKIESAAVAHPTHNTIRTGETVWYIIVLYMRSCL